MAKKKFQDLDLKNAFLFAVALKDPETCKLILEIILGRSIPEVKVYTEHTIMLNSDFRSVRLDVYASDAVQVTYDLEMQNDSEKILAKRSRFYQAEIDVGALEPGSDFSELKPSYVIFICTFDPFGQGLYCYTFEERCLERDFPLEDGTRKIFLNTKGKNPEEVSGLLVNFLQYVENSTDAVVEEFQNNKLDKLHRRICTLKKSREWRGYFMTLGEYLDEEAAKMAAEQIPKLVEKQAKKLAQELAQELAKEQAQELAKKLVEEDLKEGEKAGFQQGQSRMLRLIIQMQQSGENDLIPELEKNQALLEQMYQKYDL